MDYKIWNILHDGSINAICSDGSTVRLNVQILYLTERLIPSPGFLVLRLKGCDFFSYTPWDLQPIQDLKQIEDYSPTLLSAEEQNDTVQICCVGGMIYAKYQSVEICLDSGEPLSIDELEAISVTYWDEFEARSRARRTEP